MSEGLCTSNCVRCNEAGVTESKASASPLFSCLGYSKPEDGSIGVAVTFKISKDAIAVYEAVTGASLEYGAVAAAYDNLGDKTILDSNGDATKLDKGGVIKAQINQERISTLSLKITGFTKEEHKDTKLVLGAYVIEAKESAKSVSYLQASSAESGLYSYITYNTIEA